eukprot:TRINITY_DN2315_c0_g1_i1.p1 TRINITY_DN2315_c0_g1~~TRINITY_DN2315_c0_g1_i1.p1  ORF type:complete len:189 (+),score=28.91 TRINITY_DN2315_c0_g1_i1:72-638(+)
MSSGLSPYLSSAIKFGLFTGTGDLINQKLVLQQPWEPIRTFKIFSWGFCFAGPFLHRYLLALEAAIPGTSVPALAKKVLFDQTCCAPFVISSFLSWMSIFSGGSLSDASQKIQRDLWPTLKLNWLIWPTAQAINFGFVPIQHRIVYIGSVSILWNTIMSYMEARHTHNLPTPTTHGSVIDEKKQHDQE